MYAYAGLIAAGKNAPPPPGYTEFADELSLFAAFQRITFYNYSVFGEFYHKVLNDSNAATSDAGDPATGEQSSTTDNNQTATNGSTMPNSTLNTSNSAAAAE